MGAKPRQAPEALRARFRPAPWTVTLPVYSGAKIAQPPAQGEPNDERGRAAEAEPPGRSRVTSGSALPFWSEPYCKESTVVPERTAEPDSSAIMK